MTAPRTFTDKPAVREQVPLLIGLMGPSGGGKSYSALRLATGIQRVTGGDIHALDTESRRLLHYADQFTFRHIDFLAPYDSLDYLAGIRHCVGKGASVVIVDSMSHEHTGDGGYLSSWEAELDRMAGKIPEDADERTVREITSRRDKMKFAGLIRPAFRRRKMIDGILHLPANFIFCFRAKEKIKPLPMKDGEPTPMRDGGRLKMQAMGFMPIAGEELVFEMTVNALLLPKANGVPTWRSDEIGERLMMKLPGQFAGLFPEGRALDEDTGQALAEWARGQALADRGQVLAARGGPSNLVLDDKDLLVTARIRAGEGTEAYRHFWAALTADERHRLREYHEDLKKIARDASSTDAGSSTSASDEGGAGEVPRQRLPPSAPPEG